MAKKDKNWVADGVKEPSAATILVGVTAIKILLFYSYHSTDFEVFIHCFIPT